jgi:hypothetical protein
VERERPVAGAAAQRTGRAGRTEALEELELLLGLRHRFAVLVAIELAARLAQGASVIEYTSSLNVLKDTHDYSCHWHA